MKKIILLILLPITLFAQSQIVTFCKDTIKANDTVGTMIRLNQDVTIAGVACFDTTSIETNLQFYIFAGDTLGSYLDTTKLEGYIPLTNLDDGSSIYTAKLYNNRYIPLWYGVMRTFIGNTSYPGVMGTLYFRPVIDNTYNKDIILIFIVKNTLY